MKTDTHTNRLSNRHVPQVIDLELLYQLILRRWEFHCGEERRGSIIAADLAHCQSPPPGYKLDTHPAKALPPPPPPASL